MIYFVPTEVIKYRITKMYPKYLNRKLRPYHLSCFIKSFLHDPTNKAWPFEKFIFELEVFYSFKITCILVRQVISLKKNGGVISKIYCLILWFPICTSLILVSASVKMTGTSATVPYNSMRGASRLVVGLPSFSMLSFSKSLVRVFCLFTPFHHFYYLCFAGRNYCI